MPMYEYRCKECGHQYEELVFKSDARVPCPKCGSERTFKLVSSFAASVPSQSKAPGCGNSGCGKAGFG